jgi:hypothetical protein
LQLGQERCKGVHLYQYQGKVHSVHSHHYRLVPVAQTLPDQGRLQQGSRAKQGCQVADLSDIFANTGRMEKLLAKWKNLIWPWQKVAESGLIESISAK